MPDERPEERIGRALASLDQAIAAAPERDGAAFSDALVQVSALRDEVAARDIAQRRQRLDGLNAILSMIMAGQFPLGTPPWDAIRQARGWLADIQAEQGQGSALDPLGPETPDPHLK
ncbi:hypothetical protein [Lichenicoccus sp.]|uniref:hypothetical protein n=1 Tax=Lichenicoccus sp. TaxID=2781899 RepID=UPI003D116EB0